MTCTNREPACTKVIVFLYFWFFGFPGFGDMFVLLFDTYLTNRLFASTNSFSMAMSVSSFAVAAANDAR